MTTLRTKQQIACDGVRIVWSDDAFTNILQQQVEKHFPIDGIIARRRESVAHATSLKKQPSRNLTVLEKEKCMQYKKGIDGIRLSWKKSFAA